MPRSLSKGAIVLVATTALLASAGCSSGPSHRISGAPTVSPNGDTVLFTVESGRGTTIDRLDVTTGTVTTVVGPTHDEIGPPVFAPDGKSVYVTQTVAGVAQIHVMAPNGGSIRRLVV
jgi:Tol biopolymer transport system component